MAQGWNAVGVAAAPVRTAGAKVAEPRTGRQGCGCCCMRCRREAARTPNTACLRSRSWPRTGRSPLQISCRLESECVASTEFGRRRARRSCTGIACLPQAGLSCQARHPAAAHRPSTVVPVQQSTRAQQSSSPRAGYHTSSCSEGQRKERLGWEVQVAVGPQSWGKRHACLLGALAASGMPATSQI